MANLPQNVGSAVDGVGVMQNENSEIRGWWHTIRKHLTTCGNAQKCSTFCTARPASTAHDVWFDGQLWKEAEGVISQTRGEA